MFHVIIPTYNREKTIIRAIKSVLIQGNTDWMIYIIDDGSYDNTKQILKPYIKKYKWKIFYTYKKNWWVWSARNIWIKQALKNSKDIKNDWVIFLDSDDELYNKNTLNKIINIYDKYKWYKIYFFDAIDEKWNIYSTIDKNFEIVNYKRWLKWFKECWFIINLELFNNKNYRFYEKVNWWESLLWNRIFKDYNNIWFFINWIPIRIYYTNNESLCRIKERNKKWLINSFNILDKLLQDFWEDYKKLQPNKYGQLNIQYAEYLALKWRRLSSIKYFIKGLKYSRNIKSIILYFISMVDYKFKIQNFLINKFKK